MRVRKLGLTAGRDANGFTIHSLRHFVETHCVNAGIPQRVIDTWLGHKSDRSMAAVYYHLSDEESQHFMHGLDFAMQSLLLTPYDNEERVMIGNYGLTASFVPLLVTTALLAPLAPESRISPNLDRNKTEQQGAKTVQKTRRPAFLQGLRARLL